MLYSDRENFLEILIFSIHYQEIIAIQQDLTALNYYSCTMEYVFLK